MIELEILFGSGQGVLLPFDDREAALRFMQRALEYDVSAEPGLLHISTAYEELLIDLADITFIRMKKDNHPRLEAQKKLPEHGSRSTEHSESQASDSRTAEPKAKSEAKSEEQRSAQTEQEKKPFTVDPDGNVARDPLKERFEKAEERLKKAEQHLGEVDKQRQKVEEQLRKTTEELEDAAKEAELRKKIEDIEIDAEIEDMKGKGNG